MRRDRPILAPSVAGQFACERQFVARHDWVVCLRVSQFSRDAVRFDRVWSVELLGVLGGVLGPSLTICGTAFPKTYEEMPVGAFRPICRKDPIRSSQVDLPSAYTGFIYVGWAQNPDLCSREPGKILRRIGAMLWNIHASY